MAKKKRKKRRGSASPVDPNEKRRERLEARRQAKAEAMKVQRRRQLRERILRYVVFAGLAAAVVWFLFLRGAAPDEIRGNEVEHFSLVAPDAHTESDVEYETNPPVSGAHSQRTVPCGTYGAEIPDTVLVHNLEHAAVGIFFQPSLAHEEVDAIEKIVQDYDSHVFSAPDADMEVPIAVAAWGHKMELDTLDQKAVIEFIEFFREGGDAPEAGTDCDSTSNQTFGHAEATPSPEPSPSG